MNSIIYCRISTNKQKSLPEQILECTGYAKKKGFNVRHVLKDIGSGTKYNKLCGLKKLLNYLKVNEVQNVIVFDVTRLNRDENFGKIFDKYKDRVAFHFVSENLIIHKNSSKEEYDSFKKLFSESCNFSKKLSERIKRNVSHRKKIGQFYGKKTPFGYRCIRFQGKKFICKDEGRHCENKKIGTYKVAKNLSSRNPEIKEKIRKYYNLSIKDIKDIKKNIIKYDEMHRKQMKFVEDITDMLIDTISDIKL